MSVAARAGCVFFLEPRRYARCALAALRDGEVTTIDEPHSDLTAEAPAIAFDAREQAEELPNATAKSRFNLGRLKPFARSRADDARENGLPLEEEYARPEPVRPLAPTPPKTRRFNARMSIFVVILLAVIGAIAGLAYKLRDRPEDYVARPAAQEQKTVLRVADLEMDLIMRRVTRQGHPIDLQPREFSLLEVLMRGEGRVVTRTMLLERVWDFHFDPKTSVVETHISRLRTEIDKPFEAQLIHTVRNTGYSLHAPLAP